MTPIATAACKKNTFVLLTAHLMHSHLLFVTDNVRPFAVGNKTTGQLMFFCPTGQTIDASGQFCCDNPENLKAMKGASNCEQFSIPFEDAAKKGDGLYGGRTHQHCPATKEFGTVYNALQQRCCAHSHQLRNLPITVYPFKISLANNLGVYFWLG